MEKLFDDLSSAAPEGCLAHLRIRFIAAGTHEQPEVRIGVKLQVTCAGEDRVFVERQGTALQHTENQSVSGPMILKAHEFLAADALLATMALWATACVLCPHSGG